MSLTQRLVRLVLSFLVSRQFVWEFSCCRSCENCAENFCGIVGGVDFVSENICEMNVDVNVAIDRVVSVRAAFFVIESALLEAKMMEIFGFTWKLNGDASWKCEMH